MSLATLAGALPARLDPGNDEARAWLREELAKPAYRDTRDPITRILEAISNWLQDLLAGVHAPSRPLPTFVAAIVAVLLVALVAYLLRFVRRTQRLATGPVAAVLGEEQLTAAQYRERSQRALAEGRYAACVLDVLRAIAQDAVERTLLEDAPSLTAHEIADRLAVLFPTAAGELRWAAERFDAIAYGDASASRGDAVRIIALDRSVAGSRPVHHPGGEGSAPTPLAAGGVR